MSRNEESWPAWPTDAKPQRIVDVRVGCSADELFTILYGPNSTFVTKSQEKLGNKDYTEQPWAAAGPSSVKKASPGKALLQPADHQGLQRKTICSGSGMGLKYTNTELQRVMEAKEGGPFEVECIVQTSATYGDRFRPILKHRILPVSAVACGYSVDYVIVYISPTNSFIKKAIDRGATNGVTKNFEVLMNVLGGFKEVGSSAEKTQPASAPEVALKPQPSDLQIAAGQLPWWSPRLNSEGVRLAETAADWIRSRVGLQGSVPGAQASAFATLIAAGLLLAIIAGLLHLLQASATSCASSTGLAAKMCRTAVAALDIPSSLRQVLTSGLVLLLSNAVMAAVSARLLRMRSTTAHDKAQIAPEALARDVLDHPSAGIRFEGFEQSLESAAANIAQGEGDLKKQATNPQASGAALRSKGTQFKENLKVGLKSLMEPITRPKQPANAQSAPAAPPQGTSPPVLASAFLNASSESIERASRLAADGSARLNLPSARSDASSSAVFSDEDETRSQSGLTSKRTSGGGGLRDYMNAGALLDKTETMFAQWSGTARGQKASPSLAIPPHTTPKGPHEEYEAQEDVGLMSSSAMELANLSPKDAEELSGVPVEEEVFENERYQPFRGWGHLWPGHFLPTDRVGHWSGPQTPPGSPLNTASFDAVAPRLKQNWEWIEEGWQIDMRGLLDAAVDEEGWTYAVDFGWIQWPPQPGSGRFRKVRDYVRRRRWFRTRQFAGIPLRDSPSRSQSEKAPITRLPTPSPGNGKERPASSPENDAQDEILPVQSEQPHKTAQEAQKRNHTGLGLPSETGRESQARERPSRQGSGGALPKTLPRPISRESSLEGRRAESARDPRRLSLTFARKSAEIQPGSSGPLTSRDGSMKGFADKMSSMFAAASSSIRQTTAKRDQPDRPAPAAADRQKPALVRESAPVPSPDRPLTMRSGSEDLDVSAARHSEPSLTADTAQRTEPEASLQEAELASRSAPASATQNQRPLEVIQPSSRGEDESATNRHKANPLARQNEPATEQAEAVEPSGSPKAEASAGEAADGHSLSEGRVDLPNAASLEKEMKTSTERRNGLAAASLEAEQGSDLRLGQASAAQQEASRTDKAGESDAFPRVDLRARPRSGRRRISPFMSAAAAGPNGAAAENESSASVGEDLSNPRLSISMPDPEGSERAPSGGETLSRAMSVDEASRVIQQTQEAVEQVQRELQAMMPLMDAQKLRNGDTR